MLSRYTTLKMRRVFPSFLDIDIVEVSRAVTFLQGENMARASFRWNLMPPVHSRKKKKKHAPPSYQMVSPRYPITIEGTPNKCNKLKSTSPCDLCCSICHLLHPPPKPLPRSRKPPGPDQQTLIRK